MRTTWVSSSCLTLPSLFMGCLNLSLNISLRGRDLIILCMGVYMFTHMWSWLAFINYQKLEYFIYKSRVLHSHEIQDLTTLVLYSQAATMGFTWKFATLVGEMSLLQFTPVTTPYSITPTWLSHKVTCSVLWRHLNLQSLIYILPILCPS